ncbi:YqaE/Pmp3 family membrane protein [candidate division KSB1 bacterium]|nr:YqaE/Pmp3 family membrane protein [candidate division KSB1 bacterium]
MAKRTKRRKKLSILLILIAILLPPLAIYLKKGAGKDLLLNLILCLFFWIPGILHALYVISR